MDPIPAQPADIQGATLPPDIPSQPISPIKKFLPLILIIILILMLILAGVLLFAPSSKNQKVVPTPSIRPTATPFPPPTMPAVTQSATTSATITTKIGRLVFIKDGDIYNSDLASFSLFVKNSTPAGDKLSWSPQGNLLAWRVTSVSAASVTLAIYNRASKTTSALTPSKLPGAELIDYSWSPDEKQIAILYHDQSFHIDFFPLNSSTSAQLTPLINRSLSIKQMIWPSSKTIIFSGSDGISSLDITSQTSKLLVENNQVLRMKLSGDKTKLLYSVGTQEKSNLYIMGIDGSNNELVTPIPVKVDMGTTNLPEAILNNGFIPYGLWFPDGNKLMVGYHYLTNLPLVGIYDLVNNSFTALTPFALYENDFMVDDLRLMGARVNMQGDTPSWQISFFTLEDNARLATVRVIPDASSPAFFGNDLLPSGNMF